MRTRKRVQLLATIEDARDRRCVRDLELEGLRHGAEARETDVGERHRISVTKEPGRRIAGEMPFDHREAATDPRDAPIAHRGSIETRARREIRADAWHEERMRVARDD